MKYEEREKLKRIIEMRMRSRAQRVGNEMEADLKDTVSIEPVNHRIKKKTGNIWTPDRASPGAPPRKVSGTGRMSILHHTIITHGRVQFMFGMIWYMARLENKGHPWFYKTLAAKRWKYIKIMQGEDISDTHKSVIDAPTLQDGSTWRAAS